jgi:F-type H+-transporting ATPase subunit b
MVGVGVDISMLIQMVNFLVTLLVLNFLLFRPIRRIVRERKEKIARSEAEIERVRLGAQEKLSMFESQLEQARNEGAGKRLEVRKRARGEIAGDATKARETLRAQSAAFASAVAEKILGRGVL